MYALRVESGIWHLGGMVISVDEACKMLGCKRRRLFQLLADGTLERAPRYGREIRIYVDSVERALARPTVSARKSRKRLPSAPPLIAPGDIQI
jgi:excisionase family DNA binding protein